MAAVEVDAAVAHSRPIVDVGGVSGVVLVRRREAWIVSVSNGACASATAATASVAAPDTVGASAPLPPADGAPPVAPLPPMP